MIGAEILKETPVVTAGKHSVTVESGAVRPFSLTHAEALVCADYLRRFAARLEAAGKVGLQ